MSEQEYELARLALEADNTKIALLMVLLVALAMVVIVFFGSRLINALWIKISNDSKQLELTREAIERSAASDAAQTQVLTESSTLLKHFSDQVGQMVLNLQALQTQIGNLASAGETRHSETRQYFNDGMRQAAAEMLQALGQQQSVMHGMTFGFPDPNDPRWREYVAKASRGKEHPVHLLPVPRFGVTPIAALKPDGERVRGIVDPALYNGWIAIEQVEGERKWWGWAEKNSIVLEPVVESQPEELETENV